MNQIPGASSSSESIYIVPQSDENSCNDDTMLMSHYKESSEENGQQTSNDDDNSSKLETQTDPDKDLRLRRVEFYSNQPINEMDVDLVIVNLENAKATGGGDIDEWKLEPQHRRILLVTYAKGAIARRVLNSSSTGIQINSYKLMPNEVFDEANFKPDDRTLILRNFDSNPKDENEISTIKQVVKMFVENLIVDESVDDSNEVVNEVINVQRSQFFASTYYVRLARPLRVNAQYLQQRLDRRRLFRGRRIEMLRAVLTATALIRMEDVQITVANEDKTFTHSDLLELHFSNRKRCGATGYLSLRTREPFWLVTFETDEQLADILRTKQNIMGNNVIVEKLYNFQLLTEAMSMWSEKRGGVTQEETSAEINPEPVKDQEVKVTKVVAEAKVDKTAEKEPARADIKDQIAKLEVAAEALKIGKESKRLKVESSESEDDDTSNEICTDKIEGLKLHQVRILFINQFIKKMSEQYKDVKVSIQPRIGHQLDSGSITITGKRANVNRVHQLATEMVQSIKRQQFPADVAVLTFIDKRTNDVVQWMRKSNIFCVIEADFEINTMSIYSTELSQIKQCDSDLKASLACLDLDLKEYGVNFLDIRLGSLRDRYEKDMPIVFLSQQNGTQMRIAGFAEDANQVYSLFLHNLMNGFEVV